RDLLESGTLARYIAELSVTGLTSNPTIFDHAIKGSADYDAAIRSKLKAGKSGEALFFELALEDITRAADLFHPIFERTRGVDGWVSLEVSPLLAHDTKTTLAVARDLHANAGSPRDSRPTRAPSHRCSSAAGTSRSSEKCRRRWSTSWVSPSAGAATRLTATSLPRRDIAG